MRKRGVLGLVAASGLVLGGLGIVTPGANAEPFGYAKLSAVQKRHVSGALADALGPRPASRNAVTAATPVSAPGCAGNRGDNVKVNQNCANVTDPDLAGRGQAQNETWVAVNPNNPKQIIATYNDYRRGDGTCGVTYSRDGGRTWADTTAPNGFVRGAAVGGKPREYFQSGGDTSV